MADAQDPQLLASLSTSLASSASAAVSSATAASSVGLIASPSAASGSPSTLWLFLSLLYSTGVFLQRVVVSLVAFTTYTLPAFLFTLFSMSLTFTMNFTTLLTIFVFFGSVVSWAVRYRLLNNYNRLPPEPQRKEPEIDLFPDSQEGDSKPGFSSYLDEFLSAIKVFGYLERPVFHELTRSMQTRKLIAGETLLLEEEKGFCIVVDGFVQVFVKANSPDVCGDRGGSGSGAFSSDEDEDGAQNRQGYQLLTDVTNGAPMSSLFTILSLFTEDVKLRHEDEEDGAESAASSTTNLGQYTDINSPQRSSFSSHRNPLGGPLALPPVPPLSLNDDPDRPQRPQRPRPKKSKSVHPDILARATVDTTIAVIPASAFRRLTRIYPKATAHIVQVILARFQRVTFLTGYNYLGLTHEVLQTEKYMNRYTEYLLPSHLRGDPLDRLKEKFKRERERAEPGDAMKGIVLHNPKQKPARKSSSALRKEVAIHARLAAARGAPSPALDTAPSPFKDGVPSPRVPTAPGMRSPFVYGWTMTSNLNAFAEENEMSPMAHRAFDPFAHTAGKILDEKGVPRAEDGEFREAVLECMFRAIGLTGSTLAGPRAGTESGDASPRLVSYDARRQKAVFSNAFGQLDMLNDDNDTDSVVSTSPSAASTSGGIGGPGLSGVQSELKSEVEIVYFPEGSVLVEQGERDPGLYFVIDGFLDVSIPVDEKTPSKQNTSFMDNDILGDPDLPPLQRTDTAASSASAGKHAKKTGRKSLFMIKPGGLAGYIGSITSYRSFIDVTAKTDVYVGFLPRAAVERIVEKYPVVLMTMAKRLTSLLPRLILHIDFALEWLQVNAGQVIYHQRDASDAIYIVLNGRLRAVLEDDTGGMQVVGEYGQGDSVGELEVMTESTRPATLHAIRDTEVARFPKTLFNSLGLEHPGITIQISKIIASRMRALIDAPAADSSAPSSAPSMKKITSTLNLRTVCVLPVTAGVPVTDFAHRLSAALTQIGTTNGVTVLNQSVILSHLGRHAFSRMGKLKLQGYLADLEEKYGMVLYVADTSVNAPWTQTCISQADSILLVALAESSPAVGEYERFLVGMKTTARKELVLLHPERYCAPGLTRQWLKPRMWVNGGHHHIQMSYRTPPSAAADAPGGPAQAPHRRFGSALKQRVQILQAELTKYTSRRYSRHAALPLDNPVKSDFCRLARRLTGKSVGLVLGGGGARGIAHLGVIRALEEAGIPVDIVGGTSIGAFVGALYSRDADIVPVYGHAKRFAGRMASLWRFVLDLTYPSVSYTTGHEFNRGIFKTFGTAQIEDFWLEFYCNTTSISRSAMRVHTSGYAWRYIRASMSLAGLLPPLCDEGEMLLDGGYVDNLTVAHMKALGARTIFAVDVGAVDDDTPQRFGDSLSGFWATANRWNPFSAFPNPPTLAEIQARLAYVSSVDALERAKRSPGCLYVRPPIDAYGTLDFAKFDEIYQRGYEFAVAFLRKAREDGRLQGVDVDGGGREGGRPGVRRMGAPRRASV